MGCIDNNWRTKSSSSQRKGKADWSAGRMAICINMPSISPKVNGVFAESKNELKEQVCICEQVWSGEAIVI